MQRRQFAGSMLAAPTAMAAAPRFIKGICNNVFPDTMPLAEQFRQAKNAGFDAIELPFGGPLSENTPADEAQRIGAEARKAGVMIASVWASAMFSKNPLNHADPAVRAAGIEALTKAIGVARHLGCESILLVPARVGIGPKFTYGYQDTWDRVSAELKKVLPAAEKARVRLTPENVWNKFLVSPLEMRAFVDQFRSPWIRCHFDTGNIMQWGYPQDWILTLGERITRIHFKDFKLSSRAEQGRFVDLLEGDVDWKEVMAALNKAGYRGPVSPEYGYRKDDPEHLMKISRAVDKILSLA